MNRFVALIVRYVPNRIRRAVMARLGSEADQGDGQTEAFGSAGLVVPEAPNPIVASPDPRLGVAKSPWWASEPVPAPDKIVPSEARYPIKPGPALLSTSAADRTSDVKPKGGRLPSDDP